MAENPWKAATPLAPAVHLQPAASTGRPPATAQVPGRFMPRAGAHRSAILNRGAIAVRDGEADAMPAPASSGIPPNSFSQQLTICADGTPATIWVLAWDADPYS